MKRLLVIVLVIFPVLQFYAQQERKILKLEDCYALAEENYPLSKKRDLIAKSSEYTIDNIAKGYYPKFDIFGQATYQSDVTKLPVRLPGLEVPILKNDQYRAYAEVNQLIYDGGALKQQKELVEKQTKVSEQQLKVDLYAVKQRITELYFGILVFEEQLRQNDLLKNDINIGMKTVQAQLTNGTAFRSSLDLLKAEYLKADQIAIGIRNYRKSYLDMLGLFINSELASDTQLETPANVVNLTEIKRPELALFSYRNESLELGKKTIEIQNLPKFNFFVQGGMGNPGLNMLEEGWKGYYIGGVRLNWSLTGLYTDKKQKQIIDINKEQLEVDKEVFLFNTNQSVKQQNAEITKLEEYLISDTEIIALRNNVKKAALAQLENGVIDSSDYLRDVNEENTAAQNKIIHETDLLLAKYRQKLITGN
ncbi:TolC family protein [Flavobacterium pectinovorum]|uniref:TolC family protein n=1 Tax=Flavobacterium pectinovorum TaxID=29533 RepID=A0A502F6Z2_9FLAO|nr:TolC family protein [Flavobacterium pectinovorum]TPG45189.1 TolC family protein [Flavobacterium pectinovorum]